MIYLQTLGGFVLLLGCAELLVRGAVSLSQRLGVTPLVIGMTVVAWGTTAPELVVSLDAALLGSPGISVGNVVGSNVANILLILGVGAMIAPMTCERGLIRHDAIALLLASGLFAVIVSLGQLDYWQGAIMIILLVGFTLVSYRMARRRHAAAKAAEAMVEEFDDAPKSLVTSILILVLGVAGVVLGAHLLVEGAVGLARTFGVSEAAIGLTLVAVGTSLPELATAVVSAYRGHAEVALGNVVGANIYNVLGIMGVVSVITPIEVPAKIVAVDIWVMLVVTVIFVGLLIAKGRLGRGVAGMFLAAYVVFTLSQYGDFAAMWS